LVGPGFKPLALQHDCFVGPGFEPLSLQHDHFVGPGFDSLALIVCFRPVVSLAYVRWYVGKVNDMYDVGAVDWGSCGIFASETLAEPSGLFGIGGAPELLIF